MDYAEYLPDVDVEDGKARVMNNLKLYFRLLGKFDGEKMAGDISRAINAGDKKGVAQAAHALRGTAANLGFLVVLKVAHEIETLSKNGENCAHLIQPLDEAVLALTGTIEKILAAQ